MRLKPQVWTLISLLLFVAAICMWRHAEKYAATHQPTTTQAGALPLQHPALIKTAAGVASRKSYRISNTTQTIAQLLHNNHAIILRNALIDTEVPVALKIPAHLRAKGAPGSYLVQADRPLDKDFYAELSKSGATYISYVPNNAALVEASPEQATNISANADVIAVLPYEPYYKLDSTLLPAAVEQQPQTNHVIVNFTTFPGERNAALAALTQLGAKLIGEDRSPFGPTLIVNAPSTSLVAIAQLPLAQEIEAYTPRILMNDLTRVIMGVATNTLIGTSNYLGLTGAKVTVNLNDTGVDSTHPDFSPASRLLGDFPSSLTDTDGHGTHVAGIIAGNGSQSTTVGHPIPGSVTNADFRGKATNATLFVQALDLVSGPFISDSFLQENASSNLGPTNLISNNSWGYGITPGQQGAYDTHAASYDAATRDAQPDVKGEQPLLFVFAAGNNGNGSDDGIDGTSGTITSPGTAKNVITVGASDSPRFITNEVSYDGVTSNAVFNGETDNSNLVAYFSSCGNVGIGVEGIYGRFKPDVIAPGVFTISCRATNYVDPTNETTTTYYPYTNQTVAPNQTNYYPIEIPYDASQLIIVISSNATSPIPFPNMLILADTTSPPTTLVSSTNFYSLTNFVPGSVWYFGVTPPSTQPGPVRCDVNFYLYETNSAGNYYTVLSNMNNVLKPYYRYETGTSMSAGAVSGTLALMQEFLQSRLSITNPSPALLKAMLINGSRSLGVQYDFNVDTEGPNEQGWGLPNLPDIIPGSLTNAAKASMLLVDQSPSNALATGQYQTYTINCVDSNAATLYPLRITLVWTDPPGDPAAGLALVNNLDLTVADATGSNIYIGNDFLSGDTFTEVSSPGNLPAGQGDNAVQNVYVANGTATFTAAGDSINNVQNVYINPANTPITFPLTVTISGTRVNVNAVPGQTNNIAQDYALVIESDDPALSNSLTIVTNPIVNIAPVLVTVASNGVPLLHQRVGANEPNLYNYPLASTNGNASQWHFFVFTNNQFIGTNQATNVAFATFLPPDLSIPRASGSADIDLYVSTNSQLTNLVDSVVNAADKSVGRTGTESIIYTNSFANEVYYIGVKSEDQQASDFGFYGVAQQAPFSTISANGNTISATGVNLPVFIPNAVSSQPALVFAIMYDPNPLLRLIRRATVTLGIQHGNPAVLYGTVQFNGVTTIINHNTGTPGGFTNTYDDLQEDPASGDITTDGFIGGDTGLAQYVNQPATGVWLLTEADNALTQTGYVTTYSVSVDLQQPTSGFFATIPGQSWYIDYVDVPNDATNMIISALYENNGTNLAGTGPIGIYMTNNIGPLTTSDYGSNGIVPPGGFVSLSSKSPVPGWPGAPPLAGGLWYYGIYNSNTSPVTVFVQVTIQESITPNLVQNYTNNTFIPLTTDAHTQSQLCISNGQQVVALQVGVRLTDTNLDDLVLHLISPEGTSALLFEDRGGTNASNLGQTLVTNIGGTNYTNYIYTVFTENTNLTTTPIKFAPPPYASNQIVPATNLWSNSFETVSNGVYTNGAVLEGWLVTSNVVNISTTNGPGLLTNDEVGIVQESPSDLNYLINPIGTNYLALTSGRIVQTFPGTNTFAITNGQPYELIYYARPIDITNWWPADNNTYDIISGDTGTTADGVSYVDGEVDRAWNFSGTNIGISTGNEVDFGTTAGNFGMNDFSVDFWIKVPVSSTATNVYGVLEKRPICNGTLNGWDIRIGPIANWTNPAPGEGVLDFETYQVQAAPVVHIVADLFSSNVINDGIFHHVTCVREGTVSSIYIDGILEARGINPIANVNSTGTLRLGQSMCVGHGNDESEPLQGNMDEVSLYTRALSPAEAYAIYHAGSLGKYGTNGILPNFDLIVDGVLTNNITLTNPWGGWQLFTNSFIAASNQITVEFSGNPLGVLFDDIQLVQLPVTNDHNYFLPEEPLTPFVGENPLGCWTLDVWDTRDDSLLPTNGALLSWSLQLTTSSTNVSLNVLSNGVPSTNTVTNNSIVYFAIDVPDTATYATNLLKAISGGPFTLLFNQDALPTGNLPGDVTLTNGVSPVNTSTNTLSSLSGLPPLLPGQRYFLGVLSTGAGSATFSLQVNFNIVTNTIIPLTNAIPYTNTIGTNVTGASGPEYYSFVVPTNAVMVTFQILSQTNGEVDLYAREGLPPLPGPDDFDYECRNTNKNFQLIAVTTNSDPIALPVASTNDIFPLTPTTWYLCASNAAGATNGYTIVATYVTSSQMKIIPLTNAIPYYTNATPGYPTNLVFSFTVTNNPPGVEFVVTNLSGSGNVQLLADIDGFPTPDESYAGSFNAGTAVQVIQIFPNAGLPSLNGVWYLSVPNTSAGNVNYSITAYTNFIVAPPNVALTWSGAVDSYWDILVTSNWVVTATPSMAYPYQNGCAVTFDDTAPGPTTINLTTTLAPTNVTVSNSALIYDFTGSGSITGAPLIKTNTGLLIIDNSTPNNFTSVSLKSGTLQIGNNDANGALAISGGILGTNTFTNGFLVFDRSDNPVITNIIGGPCSLSQIGAGILSISGVNTYTGATLISNGTLVVDNTNALGPTNGQTVTITGGGALDLGGLAVANGPANPLFGLKEFNISGAGVNGNGAIVNNGLNQQLGGIENIVLSSNATIGGTTRWDIRNGTATLALGSNTLTKTGNNQISAVSPQVSSGNIIINQGILSFEGTPFFAPSSGTITVNSGGLVGQNLDTLNSFTRTIVLNGGGTTNLSGGGTTYLDAPIQLANNSSLANGAGIEVFNGIISGGGGLTSYGAGNNQLSAANTYSGATVVQQGTLSLINNGAINNSTSITVNSGAILDATLRANNTLTLTSGQTLFDNGTVKGNNVVANAGSTVFGTGLVNGNLTLSANSTFSPGANAGTIGTLSVNGTATLGGTSYMEINKSASPSNDVLIANSVVYGGTLIVTNLSAPNSFVAGDTFKLYNTSSSSGAFSSLVLPALTGGLAWSNTFGSSGPGTLTVVTSTNQPVIAHYSLTLSPPNVVFNGTNGVPGGQYVVLMSTKVWLPLTSWTPVQTNNFDNFGNFSFTNAITTNTARFFILQSP